MVYCMFKCPKLYQVPGTLSSYLLTTTRVPGTSQQRYLLSYVRIFFHHVLLFLILTELKLKQSTTTSANNSSAPKLSIAATSTINMAMEEKTSFLCLESKKHIAFLQTLHLSGITLQKPSVESLRRYFNIWLPLVYHHNELRRASNNDFSHMNYGSDTKSLIPPNDVAWLWHCHRLAPYRYVKHIQKQFFGGKSDESLKQRKDDLIVLDPELPFVVQLEDNDSNKTLDNHQYKYQNEIQYTKDLWEALYPLESFFLSEENNHKESLDDDFTVKLDSTGFDVLESCQRQAAFLWQVSQNNFSHDDFLQQGVNNYYKFMSLMTESEKKPRFLVPTYQIDLIWHTHILHSIKMYHMDCMNVIGT